MTAAVKAELVKSLARAVGFDAVGIAPVRPSERASYYRQWLKAGYAGGMRYLARHVQARENPGSLLPQARSIICVGLSYSRGPETAFEAGRGAARVARYARGEDYHILICRMLGRLVDELHRRLGEPFGSRVCVDTAPLLERELAAAGGIGWIGKNTCLISPQLGSYVLLGEAITTLDLPADEPAADGCGRCERCLRACPTGALMAPYQLDASRCISYLTIEHRGVIPAEFHRAIGDWVFGCDLCQEACPYNRKCCCVARKEGVESRVSGVLDLTELAALRASGYRRLVSGTALRRARRNMLRRNALVAIGNVPWPPGPARGRIAALLAQAARDEDPGVRDAARRTIARI